MKNFIKTVNEQGYPEFLGGEPIVSPYFPQDFCRTAWVGAKRLMRLNFL
jgi:hypothetical protein